MLARMPLKNGVRGAEVRALQADLVALGYALPRWGVDGDLGFETRSALTRMLSDHGRLPLLEHEVSDAEVAFVAKVRAAVAAVDRPVVADRRVAATRDHVFGRRPWTGVTGITLHQTACTLGENPPRWDSIGAHVGVTRAGRVIWIHDFTSLVAHGNGWNSKCVGIEMDGLYEGIEGDPSTLWDDPSTATRERASMVTPELVASARAAIRWICAEVAAHGGRVGALVAHRQSSKDRRNDPGSALWQAVALPMQASLGLSSIGGQAIGSGYPIPEAWDPARVGVKY